ncbi:hypothetical protein PsYK624_114750 [Phanerochaete sordida]|uniref:Uncharacterized protein n=1 Tax=Phanerochaete sordida TaxID=48140 RepID=A0A9P3LIL4_9APHY|nr:hypothetical protein PsYK624_114750 [Phanerochaete sordida]
MHAEGRIGHTAQTVQPRSSAGAMRQLLPRRTWAGPASDGGTVHGWLDSGRGVGTCRCRKHPSARICAYSRYAYMRSPFASAHGHSCSFTNFSCSAVAGTRSFGEKSLLILAFYIPDAVPASRSSYCGGEKQRALASSPVAPLAEPELACHRRCSLDGVFRLVFPRYRVPTHLSYATGALSNSAWTAPCAGTLGRPDHRRTLSLIAVTIAGSYTSQPRSS